MVLNDGKAVAVFMRYVSSRHLQNSRTYQTPILNSLITPEITAAMLVERIIAKLFFGNLALLLCKT